ncbi:MAG: alpha/beta hydrolase, partial [Bacteroidota bacterium]
APSIQKTSIENFALCEYLASHGFIVLASPSRGTDSKWMVGQALKNLEAQSRDIEFLLKVINNFEAIDKDNIALMAYSFGGFAASNTIMRNESIKAYVSLDGSERYNYTAIEKSPSFDLTRFDIPYVHFAQKDIPEEVLVADNIPAELNNQFQLYDSLQYSQAYSYKFHDLTHTYFSAFSILFANRDKRQDKSDDKIMASYRLLAKHTLIFLQSYLQDDPQAKAFMGNSPEVNGYAEALLTQKMKNPIEKAFNYKDFNDLAVQQSYENLIPLYQATKQKHPNLQLNEGMLNTLGLRLSFNPQTKEQGYNIFILAIHIYPESSNLYDSLGEGYYLHKDFTKAKAAFKKSLDLNPQNQNAINRLKELEK